MPDYGDVEYWNNRYEMEITDSFDWLFEYKHVEEYIQQLIKKSDEVLIVGSGNALFSKDMYDAGYSNLINIDLSNVVIDQMQNKYPEMQWKVMDALDMKFPSCSFPAIVDKSLIDTFLCYQNSIPCTKQFIRECYRVLAPSGIMISFSLHSPDEVVPFFNQDGIDWTYTAFRVVNPRWDQEDNCHRSVAHTMVVSQRNPITLPNSLQLDGVLTDLEFEKLRDLADQVRDIELFRKATVNDMMSCLEVAIHLHTAKTAKGEGQDLGRESKDKQIITENDTKENVSEDNRQ